MSNSQQAALGCDPTNSHRATPVCQAQHKAPDDSAEGGSLLLFLPKLEV